MAVTNIEMEMIFTILFFLEVLVPTKPKLLHLLCRCLLANRLSTKITMVGGLICKTNDAIFPSIKLVLDNGKISIITVMSLVITIVDIEFSCWNAEISLDFCFFV